MSWNQIATFEINRNDWTFTPLSNSSLFRIRHTSDTNDNLGLFRGAIAQVFEDEVITTFDIRKFFFRIESEVYLFIRPEGLLRRKLAIKRLDNYAGNWDVVIEELENMPGIINIGDINNLQTALDDKADLIHGHQIDDIQDLRTELDSIESVQLPITIDDITNLQSLLNSKASIAHNHMIDDVTNLQTQLDSKAPATHFHDIEDTFGLQTELNKIPVVSQSPPQNPVNGLIWHELDGNNLIKESWIRINNLWQSPIYSTSGNNGLEAGSTTFWHIPLDVNYNYYLIDFSHWILALQDMVTNKYVETSVRIATGGNDSTIITLPRPLLSALESTNQKADINFQIIPINTQSQAIKIQYTRVGGTTYRCGSTLRYRLQRK